MAFRDRRPWQQSFRTSEARGSHRPVSMPFVPALLPTVFHELYKSIVG